MRRTSIAAALFTLAAGCAHAQVPDSTARPDSTATDTVTVPVYGRLNQNDIAIRMRNDEIDLRFVPLDQRLTSLLSQDGATALDRLVDHHRAAIDSAGRDAGVTEPGLALVTFYGLKDGVRFDPQLVTITARGRLLRPLAIVPLSPRFGGGQLDARESAMAIYLYEELLPVWDPFTVSYGTLTSADWSQRLPTLDRERQRLQRGT